MCVYRVKRHNAASDYCLIVGPTVTLSSNLTQLRFSPSHFPRIGVPMGLNWPSGYSCWVLECDTFVWHRFDAVVAWLFDCSALASLTLLTWQGGLSNIVHVNTDTGQYTGIQTSGKDAIPMWCVPRWFLPVRDSWRQIEWLILAKFV